MSGGAIGRAAFAAARLVLFDKLAAFIASIPRPVIGLPVLLALLATLFPPDYLQPCPS